ncbi:MAG: STAS domain-containing protein [Clostridia bacterium]|nr:STAS domain-containing protein [Clostridia bacterium]MBR0444082.1 STAS domain-containing protein [Clostridia bacterium]
MEITKKKDGGALKIALEGRLDTSTAPSLEETLSKELSGVTDLEFDFAKLEYISSAGLRVLLSTQKIMKNQGTMKVKNVCPEIMEVFDITGFSEILTIE